MVKNHKELFFNTIPPFTETKTYREIKQLIKVQKVTKKLD